MRGSGAWRSTQVVVLSAALQPESPLTAWDLSVEVSPSSPWKLLTTESERWGKDEVADTHGDRLARQPGGNDRAHRPRLLQLDAGSRRQGAVHSGSQPAPGSLQSPGLRPCLGASCLYGATPVEGEKRSRTGTCHLQRGPKATWVGALGRLRFVGLNWPSCHPPSLTKRDCPGWAWPQGA